jgi:hypothetical protein
MQGPATHQPLLCLISPGEKLGPGAGVATALCSWFPWVQRPWASSSSAPPSCQAGPWPSPASQPVTLLCFKVGACVNLPGWQKARLCKGPEAEACGGWGYWEAARLGSE